MDFTHIWKHTHNNTWRPLSELQVMVQFYLQLSEAQHPPSAWDPRQRFCTSARHFLLNWWTTVTLVEQDTEEVLWENDASSKQTWWWQTELHISGETRKLSFFFFFFNKRHNLMCLWEGEKSIEMLTYLNQWWKGCTTWVLLPFHHCYK